MIKFLTITLLLFNLSLLKKKIEQIELSQDNKTQQIQRTLQQTKKFFQISLSDLQLSSDQNFFLIVESNNEQLKVKVYDTSEQVQLTDQKILIDLMTYSGNFALAMSDTYFNSKLDFFRKNKDLYISIEQDTQTEVKTEFTIRVEVSENLKLPIGKSYTTRLDQKLENLTVSWNYNKDDFQNINKLRFQAISVLNKDNYSLSAQLKDNYSSYKMNNLFKNLVGGVLDSDNFKICSDKCEYKMTINFKGVKVVNFESFLVEDIEELSIYHYGEYYDKVYQQKQSSFYKLKYVPEIEGMDISVNLIPVTGNTGLYVNPTTKPLTFDSYLFKQTGPLAKRITIKWEELLEMKAEKQDLFIAIQSFDQGEFLIKIDAHESDYRGRLSSGISEQGYVKGEEMGTYLYSFQVYETQDIDFTVQLNIFSGEADLYLKQCKTMSNCKLTEQDVNKPNDILKVQNEDNFKSITHQFKCKSKHKHSYTICNFLIGTYGKENHKTHYEISIQENKFHTLMTPGNNINISLMPDQIKYFKFSYPGGSEITSQLYLQIEPEWGSFAVAISKKEEFPSQVNNSFYQEFLSHESNLYNSSKSINLGKEIKDFTDVGLYYIAIIAKTNSSLSLKFYQKNKTQFAIHTLQAGKQQQGMISNSEEIIYYMINLSLDEDKANSVSIDIVPIKGQFIIFASRSGKLPSKQSNEIISSNDHLDLLYKNYDRDHQYIIGVQGNTKQVNQDIDFQFKISLTYKNKTTKLSPGIISTFQAKESNFFQIDIFQEMNDLLILKGVNDGYTLLMCAQFNKKFDLKAEKNCEQSADNKRMGIYFNKDELKKKCKESFKNNKNCLLYISVQGFSDQKFSIGYTYNDQPLKLTEGQLLIGPGINDKDYKLNFIYHSKDKNPVAIYFNTKGQNLKIYSKLIGNKEIQNQDDIVFPNIAYQDEDNKQIKGHISTIMYSQQQIENKGVNAEVLISIQLQKSKSKFDEPYDMNNGFILQSFNKNKEILRTQVHQEHVYEEQWYYFNFYNNGNQDTLQVYVNANHSTVLNLMIAKDKDSQPPFDQRPIIQKTGVGQVSIELTPQILKDSNTGKQSTKGYFTVAVKSSSVCFLNIYWNNKSDLNYIELTPNIPSTMHLIKDKPLYFYFYAQEKPGTDMNDKITIHWKSDVKSTMYLTKSLKSVLVQPSETNPQFKSNLGKNGGISVLQIQPNDSNYCNDCSYIGMIKSDKSGQVLLMANVEHSKISCTLTTGFNFPDLIEAQRGKTYRYLNLDQEPFYINLSLLNGIVNVFVGKDESVSVDNNIKSFFIAQNLSNHAHLEVNPRELGIADDEDVYIRLENSKLDSAALTINIFKNFLHSPLEPGVSRMLALEANQKFKLFFRNKNTDSKFELRTTLKKIDKRENEKIALTKMNELIQTTFEDSLDIVIAEVAFKKIIKNKIYMEFEPQMQQEGLYYFWIKNPFNYQIHVQLDLVQGKQMLVNLNDNIIDHNFGKESSVYEAYGQQGRFWFMDLKVCYGEVMARFYEDDYDKVGTTDFKKYKSVKDSNSIAHYFHLESDKVFTEIINKDTKNSIYSFTFYNEQDLNDNPYSDLDQQEDGRVKVQTDLNQLHFEPLSIKNIKNDDFIHKVTYRAYLSPEFKVMRFLKNCNDHLIDKIFIKPKYLVKEKTFYYKNTREFNKQKTIDLKFDNLDFNVKYYGVVVVDLELLPVEEGWINPVRTSKSYYDEFIFVSTKLSIPINLLTGGLVVLVVFYIIYQIVYSYVFGELYDVEKGKSLTKFSNLTNNVLGIDTEDILESEFEIDEPKKQDTETPLDIDKDINIEMNDRTTPLDINQ